MKVGAVFVLYNPSPDIINKLKEYESKYANTELIFVDNSPSDASTKIAITDHNYFYNGNKGGIAGALNIGVNELFKRHCDFVFTFDQDSELPDEFFNSMINFINLKKANIVCPNFYDINSKTYATFVELTKWKYTVVDKPATTAFAISSGLGFSKHVWEVVNPFDESYIIDHVDTKFCLEAHDKRIPIFVNYDVCLNHEIGNRVVKRFLGVTLKPNNHNEIRKYYIVRNGTVLGFKYLLKYPSYFYLNILRVVHEYLCVILYESSKLKKVYFMTKGLLHSLVHKMGPVK
ncbi:TPA: glycosyltransferase [Klebsiella oxytoca]|jgi:rhamnosyltransferase|uniref:glycosyltransferase n=1 Tax=Klebsiella oxytoca TaxID=571 RepID=UPI00224544AD|nr:glycosyltransferase [Klebsiella oxytoca]ELR9653679.1 glycosyltransferase [Klebsiella oxytoca]MCW9518855.1 glycosyltransferase [Klebsiella oxytoca]MCW9628631.1 glycosyltransferase [Klebsiella oxytoca]HEJ9266838.1 glycosyltransferase [Klebsiella oxytoca]